jgi:hypothetical protein
MGRNGDWALRAAWTTDHGNWHSFETGGSAHYVASLVTKDRKPA